MKLFEVSDKMYHDSCAISREPWMTVDADGIVRCNRGFYKAKGKIVEAKMSVVNGEIKSVEVRTVWDTLGESLHWWEINSHDWVVLGKMELAK